MRVLKVLENILINGAVGAIAIVFMMIVATIINWKNADKSSLKNKMGDFIPNNDVLYRLGILIQGAILIIAIMVASANDPGNLTEWTIMIGLFSVPVWFLNGMKWLVSKSYSSVNTAYVYIGFVGILNAFFYNFFDDTYSDWGEEEQIGLFIFNVICFLIIRSLMNLKSSREIIDADKKFNVIVLKVIVWIIIGFTVLVIIQRIYYLDAKEKQAAIFEPTADYFSDLRERCPTTLSCFGNREK